MKPVKLVEAAGATFAPGKNERCIYSHNSYKARETRLMTGGPIDATATPCKPLGIFIPGGRLDLVHDRLQAVGSSWGEDFGGL